MTAHKAVRKIKRLMVCKHSRSIAVLSLGTLDPNFMKKDLELIRGDGIFCGKWLVRKRSNRRKPPKVRVVAMLTMIEMSLACEGIVHNETKKIQEQTPKPAGRDVAAKNSCL